MKQPAAAPNPANADLAVLRAAERAFDRVFQATANPWRHLGALAFYFFWIATATGIYLYIFFDTSVAGAYRSVETLTREQWYAGGVMRSIHRYASDALVVCVVLHMLKELLGGRFAGFRWFSWVSGVPLPWLMLASGIVGYWLVWDELAQFVAAATAEWFDALPLFAAPLARNFIVPESVSDRLFTLLIFLHIALPLALLAGMFIHVQRVNYADVIPARALGWGTLLALLALAQVWPATSHGPADLAAVPQAVALDWFYLFFYPLVYEWSADGVWVLAGTATLALLVLPLAARRAQPPVAQVDLANCNGCARCFADCPYAAVVMRPRQGGRRGRQHAVVIPGLCASCGICAGACPSSTPFRSGEHLVTGIDMPQQPIATVRQELERALLSFAQEEDVLSPFRPEARRFWRSPARTRAGASENSRLTPHPSPAEAGEGRFVAQAGCHLLAQESTRRVIVFGCDHGAAVAACNSPEVTAFSLLCIGMLPPAFVEYALRHGADGVLIAACRDGECAYRLGNLWLGARLAGAREPHLRASLPRGRLRWVYAGPGEEAVLRRELAEFRAALACMLRNQPRHSSRDRRRADARMSTRSNQRETPACEIC